MVRCFSSHQNALKRLPEREARLLWITLSTPPGPQDGADQEPEHPGEHPDPTHDIANHARDRVHGTLERGHGHEHSNTPEGKTLERLKATEKKMKTMNEKLGKIFERAEHNPRLQAVRKQSPAAWYRFISDQRMIRGELISLSQYIAKANFLTEWRSGAKSPQEFLAWLEEEFPVDPSDASLTRERRGVLRDVRNYIENSAVHQVGGDPPNFSRSDYWSGISNTDSKIIINDKLARLGLLSDTLEGLNGQAEAYEKAFAESTIEKDIAMLEKIMDEKKEEKDEEGSHDDHGHGLNLEFFSVNNIIGGVKQWGEAFKKAWHNYDEHKKSGFAKKIGKMFKWLPFGDIAERELDSEVESHNNKLKGEFKEFLESRKPKFWELFGDHGILEDNKKDANAMMAILEYAADRGWLYKINEGKRKVFGHDFEHMVHHDWTDAQKNSYWDSLVKQNEAGASKATSEGKDKVDKFDKLWQFMGAFEKSINECNFWATVGIAESMIGRAKDSTTSAMIAVHLFRILRENPQARSVIPDVIFERLPFPVWHKGYLTAAHLTMDKEDIRKWIVAGNPENLSIAGNLGSTIGHLEHYVREHSSGAEISSKEMADIISKMLGMNTVKAPGTDYDLTMFEVPETKKFRTGGKALHEYARDFNLENENPDYYTSPSEVIIAPPRFWVTALALNTSHSDFLSNKKVSSLIGQVILRVEEMQANGKEEALKQFRDELKEKLVEPFNFIATSGVKDTLLSRQWSIKQSSGPLIASLRRYDLIPEESWGKMPSEAKAKIEAQVKSMENTARLVDLNSDDSAAPADHNGHAADHGHHAAAESLHLAA